MLVQYFTELFLYIFIYSTALLHRCIPTSEAVQDAYELLNSWSIAQQLFSDLYTTWPTMLMMCFLALGEFYPPHSAYKFSTLLTNHDDFFTNTFDSQSSLVDYYDWINERNYKCNFVGHLYICGDFKCCCNYCTMDHIF